MPQAAVQEAVQQNEKELLRTAAYARLSVENGGHETEDSLHTQILQIHNYIRENPELTLTDTYADNGFTGTRFDRPEFERMMQDVRTGKIQCIVVKDLSRFGRDYIETGSYLETIFPMLHVRFIAINDDFDNIRQSDVDSLAVPIKNMVNSLYAKDISKKISLSYQMRREKGIPTSWCTPYGYQLNQQGNKLEATEDAKWVKLIYQWYLAGVSTNEIARRLEFLEVARPNERLNRKLHEGDKSKKNNNDRTQYRQKNHHEAIVSREVFNAANHLRASRNYSKKNRPLPVLSVVEDGILRGYVPFDKDWTGFSAEEYREASESVMKEPDVTVTADVKKRLDLTGYEIVRVQYFSTMQNPAMTISNGRLRFNTACLKKFENVEYVELLLNSVERCIAIRPCDKNNPNAIRWGRLKEGRWCASTLGCRGLAKTLFDIMEWDEDLRYRFRGQFLEQGDNKMMLFAFDEPEMIKVEEIVLPPKENTEEDEGETVKKKIYIFPPEWAGTFGQPITSIAQVGILRQEHYAGNWDVFRPATEIEEMNIFTAESLNELLREAEKIMEGWTDYR